MGSDDFISLDPSSDSENQREGKGLHESYSVPGESEGGVPDGDNVDKTGENDDMEEAEHEQDMDLESDSVQEQTLVDSRVMMEMLKEFQPEKAPDDASLLVSDINANNRLIDDGPGVKRVRMTYAEQQPCVRVVYNFLTRESKRKLMELMQQWSEWHAKCKSSSTVTSKEALENGEETYFPALYVGSEKTSVSFWVDNQASNAESIQVDKESVPLYDRGYTLGSTSLVGSADFERMETLEAARCFNCGSYSHSVKECTKPRDNAAINNSRKQHNSKRKSTTSHGQLRYYQKSQGKFDDLKAGVLGAETRESLGIGELDPPPWLHRMRELGYPPGYLDDVEEKDQPSGITIFGEETNVEYEDGELPEKGDPVPPEKKMTVEFPGINAPIPENADHRCWVATPSNSLRNRVHHQRSIHSVDSQRGPFLDHRRNDGSHIGNEGLPGTEYGSSSGTAAVVHSYSPRYPYDHNNSPHTARSPSLGRSLSDRGWQNPVGNDGLPVVHSPSSSYPKSNPTVSWQSPAHPYASPSTSFDRWTPAMPSQQQAGKERQDHHYDHHRRHHRN